MYQRATMPRMPSSSMITSYMRLSIYLIVVGDASLFIAEAKLTGQGRPW
jgi:hypothetical protein